MKRVLDPGPEPESNSSEPKKRGRQARPINKLMSVATFNSGAPAAQVQELMNDDGVISPSTRGQQMMLENTKNVILGVSE